MVLALGFLFAGWLLWIRKGTVSIFVVSQRARLEAQGQPVPVQAPVDGQIVLSEVRLGRAVHAGDIVLQLDSKPIELQRAALQVALRTGAHSLEALRSQLEAEKRARDAVSQLAVQSSNAANARISQEQKGLELKERESAVVSGLRAAAAISGLDALHAAASVETQRAQLATTAAQATLDTRSGSMNLRDREARLAAVSYAVAQGEADIEKLEAQIKSLDYEIDRRTVRAPISGTMVDVMPLSPGMTITSSQQVTTLLPDQGLRVVAFFAPQESIGRVRRGQSALLRIDNFPWTQFGTVDAVVQEVGREPRDGLIRVELGVSRPNPAIPLEHGLTASCEVEVEQISPLALVLRSAGHLMKGRSTQ
jgi:multidrug resistance efflux pump